jgi:two-component system response regulator AlgR
MKVMIVDDEKLARNRLRQLVSSILVDPDIREAGHGGDALASISRDRPDLVLLDIRMPVMDGIETAMHLSAMDSPPAVIFTTAYDDHALEAFEVNAVDYLLKPIRRDRLATAIERVRPLVRERVDGLRHGSGTGSHRTHISVQLRGQILLIPIRDVAYFSADNKYVRVRTHNEEYLIEDSLVSLEKEFAQAFLRIHRNALAAVDHIRGIDRQPSGRWQVRFNDIDDTLEVSRRHTANVRRWLRGDDGD